MKNSVQLNYRLMTAALHFNENAGREQAVNWEGNLEYKIVFPKYKKGGNTKSSPSPGFWKCA